MNKLILTTVIFLAFLNFSCTKPAPSDNEQQFSLVSVGGTCSGAVPSGSFVAARALTSTNTLTISISVSKTGPYHITTDTVNGIFFNVADTFRSTGLQSIILKGKGTPTAVGSFSYKIKAGPDNCMVSVTTISAGTLTCKLNGVYQDFSRNILASLVYNAGANMKVSGSLVSASNYSFQVWIQHPTFKPLVAGTYSIASPGFYVKGQYTDPVFNYWIGDPGNATQTNPFTVVITSVTATNISGTFSGRIREMAGFGPLYKDVTEGNFNVAL